MKSRCGYVPLFVELLRFQFLDSLEECEDTLLKSDALEVLTSSDDLPIAYAGTHSSKNCLKCSKNVTSSLNVVSMLL